LGNELSPSGTVVGSSLASLKSTPSVSRSSFSVSCHVLFGLPTLLLPPSGLVVGNRSMCTTNRLRLLSYLVNVKPSIVGYGIVRYVQEVFYY